MKALVWIGLLLVIIGVASFFVAVPGREKHGVKIGDTTLGVETQTSDKLPPAISGLLVAGGIVLMIVGGRQRHA